jgi:hypothetical protein
VELRNNYFLGFLSFKKPSCICKNEAWVCAALPTPAPAACLAVGLANFDRCGGSAAHLICTLRFLRARLAAQRAAGGALR